MVSEAAHRHTARRPELALLTLLLVRCSATEGATEPSSNRGAFLLLQMEDTYAALSEYHDTGDYRFADVDEHAFATSLSAQKLSFLFYYHFGGSGATDIRGFSGVPGSFSIISDGKVSDESPRALDEVAGDLLAATRVVSWRVPRLLAGEDVFQCRCRCPAVLLGEEVVDGVACTRVKLQEEGRSLTFTIGARDHLIRQIEEIDDADPRPRVTRYRPVVDGSKAAVESINPIRK